MSDPQMMFIAVSFGLGLFMTLLALAMPQIRA
jgi:hypothetical protein